VKSATASPASETLLRRTCRLAPARHAPAAVAALKPRHGWLARLVIASSFNAFLLLMPIHAAGPPSDVEVGRAATAPAKDTGEASAQAFPMEEFLDRLMAAESGGRLNRKNPRSTALGPFQFIESTFLDLVSRHYPSEVAGLSERQILALRTDVVFSRKAAGAYANELISALDGNGLPATAANVRLAFLVGPFAAVRLLRSPPDRPLKEVLSADAVAANPFMSGATVANLIQRTAADVATSAAPEPPSPLKGEPAGAAAALQPEPAVTLATLSGEPAADTAASKSGAAATPPADHPFEIKCGTGLASCRRWIALQERRGQPPLPGTQPSGGLAR
jgi:hypothetical protein